MGRIVGGAALLLLALLMLVGFARSSATLAAPATIAALLVTVALPALAGVALLRGQIGGRAARVERLRLQATEAEILRLAMRHGGRLTALEVASELTMSPEAARATLDGLVTREVADLAVTDGGVLVYTFADVRGIAQKHDARGLLDA